MPPPRGPCVVVACVAVAFLAMACRGDAPGQAVQHDPKSCRAVDGEPLRIVHWRTGAPLPDALAMAVPPLAYSRIRRLSGDERPAARYLAAAVLSGRPIRLDDDACGTLPADHVAVVVYGDWFACGGGGEVAPTPEAAATFVCMDPRGEPIEQRYLNGSTTDALGRVHSSLGEELGTTRFRFVAAGGPRPWGMLGPDELVLDLRAADLDGKVVPMPSGPTGTLEVVGVRDGRPEELGQLAAHYPAPFAYVGGTRQGEGASVRWRGLPLGVPIQMFCEHKPVATKTLTDSHPVRVALSVPALAPHVRYRLVDPHGQVLHGVTPVLDGIRFDRRNGILAVRRDVEQVTVRLWDHEGEEWSCAPFQLPADAPSDAGDLVLQASSRTPFCSGRVVDRQGRPVATQLRLSDDSGESNSTTSDADGRFQLCLGPWCTDPMPILVPGHHRHRTEPIARGTNDVLIEVDDAGPVQPSCRGQLLGLGPEPTFPSIGLEVLEAGTGRELFGSGLGRNGEFGFALPPGSYDVRLVLANGEELLRWNDFVLPDRAALAPAALFQPLPPSHRFARLRFVDPQGAPCPVHGLTGASATVRAIVPAGGGNLEFGTILQRIRVDGDRDVVLDPVLADVEVAGLPTTGGWFFGLSVGIPGWRSPLPIGQLVDGRGRMFVPRNVPLEAHLHAMRFDDHGDVVPFPGTEPPALANFVGDFAVAAADAAPRVGLQAPADLAAQLAEIDRKTRRR